MAASVEGDLEESPSFYVAARRAGSVSGVRSD
jgi:hypothetical protein